MLRRKGLVAKPSQFIEVQPKSVQAMPIQPAIVLQYRDSPVDEGLVMRMFVDTGSIYLHRDAVDFRKSINCLMMIVEQEMELSPFAPAQFVFCNKNRDRIKVLCWDQSGFCLWYKRRTTDGHDLSPATEKSVQYWGGIEIAL
jgi:hypothetical protein